MSERKRRITVLRDFSYTERQGEEELAIQRLMQTAPEWADVLVQPPEFIQVEEYIAQADVVITFGLKRYPDQVFGWLKKHQNHVHVAQDWWEPTQPQAQFRSSLLQAARHVFFSSEMHQERYCRLYQLPLNNASVIQSPVYERDYAPAIAILEPEDAVLWCAPWHTDYGTDILIRWANKTRTHVHAYGLGVPEGDIAPYVLGKGALALNVAAPTFRQYQKFVFFPRTPVPFGFAPLLAYMLGLEVSYSGEVGAFEHFALHPEPFWETVAA